MRLIDANRLLEDMGASCLPIMEKGISQITGDDSTIMDHINHAPTIDAVPLDRLGDFGKLFMDYKGCPRGAMGRACMPIEEEVLLMKPITDVDGGRWIPVNADALHELVKKYVSLRDGAQTRTRCGECRFVDACKPNGYYLGKYGFCSRGKPVDGDPHDGGQ